MMNEDIEILETGILELTDEEMEQISGGRDTTVRVKRGELKVYSGPGKDYSVIMTVDEDDTLTCVGEAKKDRKGKTWIKVRVYGETGWVRGDKVK